MADLVSSSVKQRVQALSELNQPAGALQSICRAVFSQSASDTATLSALYDLGKHYITSGSSCSCQVPQAITTSAAAWTLLIDSTAVSTLVLRQFVQDVFLPLVSALADSPREQSEQLEQLAQLLAAVQGWHVTLEVLQCAHVGLQATLQPATSSGAAQHAPCQDGSHAPPASLQAVQVQLPPPTACAIIAQLVPAACSYAAGPAQQQALDSDGSGALQSVLQLAAGPLFGTALQLLACADSRMRQAAFQQLLPELLQAAAALGPVQHRACLDQLLQRCLHMVARPVVPRRMGLAVLLQYWSDWGLHPPAAAPDTTSSTTADGSSGSSSDRFWQLLRECLVDPEPLNRKRALRLLQLLLPKAQLQSEPVWGVWLALYELLEEFTSHLIKATWPLISQLHRPAAAYAAEDPAADVATSKKLNLLSRGPQAVQPASQQQDQQPMPFCWSSIIWTQALQHSNLQVQRMSMKTLLKRDWSAQMLQQVPVSFFTQVLIPALLSPVHYSTQPMGKVSPSGAVIERSSDAFDVTKQAAELLSSYMLCAGPAAARGLFTGSLQAAAAMGQDLSRSGLQSVLQVLAAAARQMQGQGGGLLQDLTQEKAEVYAQASLQQLQLVLLRFMPWHGTTYKAACCSLIFNIAAAVAPPGSVRLASCSRLLQEVPLWMLGPGGPVSPACRAWLSGSSGGSSSSGSSQEWLAETAGQMWKQFFAATTTSSTADPQDSQGAKLSQGQQQCAAASDYAMWSTASDAWLRVVTCCGDELQQLLGTAVQELASWADDIMSRPYLPSGLPDRVLIMAMQLLEAAELAGRVASQHNKAAGSLQDSPVQPAPAPAMRRAALQFAAGAGGAALMRLLHLHCRCFATSPAELCSQGSSSRADSAAGKGSQLGLSPAAWQALARADMTARAAAAAAVLLAEYLAAVEQGKYTAPAAGSDYGVSVQQCAQALLRLLQHMAEVGQAIAAKPLPRVGIDKASGDNKLAWAPAAAAAELSRSAAVQVLCHLSQGMSRALSCLPRQHWPHAPLALHPVSWITALLRETTAAAEAVTHWEPALASAGATGDVSDGWVKGLDWACLDACMALTGLLSTPLAGRTVNGTAAAATATAAAAAAAASSRPGSASAERLPAGVVEQEVLVGVLVDALQALQWTPDALLHLLRCLRRVWALAVQDGELQVAANEALAAAGLAAPSAPADATNTPLARLAASLSHALMQVLHSNKKRPLLLCASLVNTLLLPELMLFGQQQHPEFVALHAGPEAPLRRFVGAVLQYKAGSSPTLPVVVALRLGACIPAAPQLLGWYAEELKYLLLFGGAMEGGLETKSSLGHEAATEWSLLAEPLEPHLASAGVVAGMGPRIAVVAALHQLALAAGLLTPPEQPQCNGHSSHAVADDGFKAAAVSAGAELCRVWLQAAQHDPVLACDSCRHGSDTHRSKVRMWQGLSAAAAFLGCPSQQESACQAVKDLLAALEAVNPPSVKQYQEAAITYLLLRHQHLISELLLPQLVDLEKGSPATASHILIAVQASLHSNLQEQLLPLVVQHLLPWTNHHTHNMRTFAQLGLCAIFEARPLDSWPAWEQGLGAGGVEMLKALQRFFDGNTDFQRFRRSVGSGMLNWVPGRAVTPAGIFCHSLSLAGTTEGSTPTITFEGCPESLMDTVLFFLGEERAKLREAAADKVAADAAAEAGAVGAAAAGSAVCSNSVLPGGGVQQMDYQRKVAPSERAVLLADVLDDAYEAARVQGSTPSGPAGTRRHQLVVVASLIDKVPNLAGLARTAEVLGAGTLVLSDLTVANDSLFTSISVTAERWVPLLEVKEAELLGWLKKQKAAGYSLVGLEQTAESTSLPSYAFPDKTVLVLGREKEGVPPEIIALLDATVEIQQGGVIRSLNVHVSGAIAMYEYTKQQLRACPPS